MFAHRAIMIVVIMMNKNALWHSAKSAFSYAYDEKTLHLVLRTAKNDVSKVTLIYGDPFMWTHGEDNKAHWAYTAVTMSKRYQSNDFDYYFVAVEPLNLRTKYAFILHDEDDTFLFGSKRARRLRPDEPVYGHYDLSEFYNFPYLNPEDLHHTPKWVKDTVWYQIFPDRFHSRRKQSDLPWGKLPVNNQELYGGDIPGVIDQLPYLKDLGVSGIYFTPIFESPSAHKYDTTDYFRIDPQFGTNEDFRELVIKAHQLGIKVMLDGVFNHAGYTHPFFQDVVRNGKQSMYRNCFYIDDDPVVNFPLDDKGLPMQYHGIPLNFKTFAFTPHMPKWNTDDPLAKAHLLAVIKYWIEVYDIDGWRLDVANEISHTFLRDIKRVSREAKKETFILGENWDSAYPWLQGDQMDSVMNYDLAYPLWSFLEHKIDLATFKDLLANYMATTPKNVMENMFNLVGSHDTIRIKRRLDDDPRRVELAYVFMFLQAGAPNIYYGDEMGMTGDHDPDNRRCMTFDPNLIDKHFFNVVKQLIRMRENHPASKDHDLIFIDVPILCFEKSQGNDHLLVFMNDGAEMVTFAAPDRLKGAYLSVQSGQQVMIGDTISLEGYAYMILQKEDLS